MTIRTVIIPVVKFAEVKIEELNIDNEQEAYEAAIEKIWENGLEKYLTSKDFICTRVDLYESENISDDEERVGTERILFRQKL